MLVATRSTTKPSVTHQHAFINELSLGSLIILSTFKSSARNVCRLHARCPLVQTAHGTRFLGRLRGSYVAAFVCRLHARGVVCRLHAHGVLCRLHTEQDFGQTTWHRRGIDVATAVHRTLCSCRLQRDSKQFHTREHTVLLPRGH